jgi:flavin-dependent dehydrogenase
VVDVDIIGGSAAGLFAAYLLAREGKRVRLFDANDVLNVESRTLITTSRLTEVLDFFPREAVVNEIDQIDLHSPGRSVTIPMKEPDLVVERSAVVRLLARKAHDAGVEIRAGCKLVDFKPSDQGSTITIRDTHQHTLEKFKSKILIGADGTSSRVAKTALGNGHPTTPLLQAVVELPNGWRAGTTQVWFEPDDTPYFYWMIPQSPTHAAIGLIAEEGKSDFWIKSDSKRWRFSLRAYRATHTECSRGAAYPDVKFIWSVMRRRRLKLPRWADWSPDCAGPRLQLVRFSDAAIMQRN